MAQQRGKVRLALPNTPGSRDDAADPAHFEDVRMIEMTHEQFVGLGDRGEQIAVAAAIQQDSLRLRILKAVALHSPIANVTELIELIQNDGGRRGGIHEHEVAHLLWGLNKEGCLKFKENKRQAREGTTQLERIEILGRGYNKAGVPVPGKGQETATGGRAPGTNRAGHAVGKDFTEARHQPTIAPAGAVMRISPPVASVSRQAAGAATFAASAERVSPKPPQEPRKPVPAHKPRTSEEPSPERVWPELQALRQRRQELMGASLRADAFYNAAAALEEVDPVEAARMLAKAEAIAGPGLSRLELEYLEFAESHTK